jgi:glycosyltransferase involved in cell wall biosynthesis
MPELPTLPPIADQPISAVLLARDEEPHLEAVLTAWLALLDGLGRDYELLVVDDASADRTAGLAEALAARHPRLRLLRHAEPRGAGAALRTALAEAGKPLLFYAPCDRQYDPSDFPRLLAEIDKVHLVSGFRLWRPVPEWLRAIGTAYRVFVRVFFGFAPEPLPGWLGWREYLYRLLVRAVFAVRLRDVDCRFRLFRREVFARLPLQSDGDFVHTEVLAKANFLTCYMNDEVTVVWRPREGAPAKDPRFGKDWRRVLSHPDFGPPPPAEPTPPTTGPENSSS